MDDELEDEGPTNTTDGHHTVASLDLSAECIHVGTYSHKMDSGDSVWIKHKDMVEPAYMKVTEAKLLIAALKAAISHAQGED